MPSTRKRRTVRIRRLQKRTLYTMSVEDFLANFEPLSMSTEEFLANAKPLYLDTYQDKPTSDTEDN